MLMYRITVYGCRLITIDRIVHAFGLVYAYTYKYTEQVLSGSQNPNDSISRCRLIIHSFIQTISMAPLQVHYYSEALPT